MAGLCAGLFMSGKARATPRLYGYTEVALYWNQGEADGATYISQCIGSNDYCPGGGDVYPRTEG